MLDFNKTYNEIYSEFNWKIPEYYNIGFDVCDKWADNHPEKLALINALKNGSTEKYTFKDIKNLSNQTANLLTNRGVRKGDRVAILLSQTPETAYAHVAIYKLGGIAVPLFNLFGEEALSFRLQNCGAKAIVTDLEGAKKIILIEKQLPNLEHIFVIDGDHQQCINFHQERKKQSETFTLCKTLSEDPAVIIYTSGTTGQAKGALHAQRILLGHLPGVEMSHNGFNNADDCFWTPADWAWIGGLYDGLMPAWHHGIPVVAHRFDKFTAEAAFQLIENYKIKNIFFPPTAMKVIRSTEPLAPLSVNSIASGGEPLGSELIRWGQETFGVTINEFYGQTECNMVVSSCKKLFEPTLGAIGLPVPGHQVKIIDYNGIEVPHNSIGNIAVKSPDPIMFLEYWGSPESTKKKFLNDWLLTGDKGLMDEKGFIQFVGRDDDVITSSGYRIGPGEIEDCLLGHPYISNVGVIGVPDKVRTEAVKAFIVLKSDITPSEELTKEIQNFVKSHLAAHEYPRQIEYIDVLPLTTTGKIIRNKLRVLHKQNNS
ncbi:MAG: acetyl-CoA synthetase [Colwellia sp.]|jgi:acetyl-CoA synthetase